ncbi:hypothetical protein DM01DRAFT_264862 [Hesseltinella vesiculosa]|uniref:Cysteine protease n=1 Tax=Hesseltinella vesiculosa TaxID=101127 RepID=A0A1X2GJ00_9FUNG|nr:hypothetical protein DM01DRAFT_264862 [Hesseltinella vesiculosa]
MNHLWMSGADLMSHDDTPSMSDDNELWLLGCRYELPDANARRMQQDILEAQTDDMFRPRPTDSTSSHDISSSSNATDSKTSNAAVMSLLWPPDFYADFCSRYWMTYRHNYPPIRPSHYKTDIGWGCMLRSGQSLLANTLLIHLLSRHWRRVTPSNPSWKTYVKITHWFLDELSPRAPFSIHRIALLGKQLGKNIGEWFGPSTISQVIQ